MEKYVVCCYTYIVLIEVHWQDGDLACSLGALTEHAAIKELRRAHSVRFIANVLVF